MFNIFLFDPLSGLGASLGLIKVLSLDVYVRSTGVAVLSFLSKGLMSFGE